VNKTVRILLIISVAVLAAGGLIYYYGHEQNLLAAATADPEAIMQISAGDRWLFAGGALMMLAGSLGLGAIKFWIHERRERRRPA
jgi:hypothetical protein